MKQRWQIFWHSFFWLAMLSLIGYFAHTNPKYSTADLLIVVLLYPLINISLFLPALPGAYTAVFR